MSYSWNALLEIHRRESGICNSMHFQRACLGSRFMVEKINASHFVGESGMVQTIDFNAKGDLLCCMNGRFIFIYDWANDKLKHEFDSGLCLPSAHFLNYGDNNLEILATDLDGTIVRYNITGEVKSTVYNFGKQINGLTSVPKKTFEVIVVQKAGKIFQLDLRTSQVVCAYECVRDVDGVTVNLYHVDHHPFAPEVCVSGYPGFLRIFDTRNFKKEVLKFSMQHLNIANNRMDIRSCLYNYNGSEIVTDNNFDARNDDDNNCDNGGNDDECLIIFENKIHDSGSVIATGNVCDPAFFGPKSEYVIYARENSIHFLREKVHIEKTGFGYESDDGLDQSCLKPHPFLPVIASLDHGAPMQIWAPTNK